MAEDMRDNCGWLPPFEGLEDPLQTFGTTREQWLRRPGSNAFERCLELVGALQAWEEKIGDWPVDMPPKSNPFVLAMVLNAEFLVYSCYNPLDGPNPFAIHWTNTISKWDKKLIEDGKGLIVESTGSRPEKHISLQDVHRCRLQFLKDILTEKLPTTILLETPISYAEKLVRQPLRQLDLKPYLAELRAAGLAGLLGDEETEYTEEEGNMAQPAKPTPINKIDKLIELVREDSDSAVEVITHLPLDLKNLENLNTLILDGHLDGLNVQSIVISFIDNCLSAMETAATREDQSLHHPDIARSAQLLVLFIQNLIKRNIISPESIYFQIQQLRFRFLWVRAVRDFMHYLETGSSVV